ncbi:MAG: flagellar basal body rod protein FlgC [Candidatus Margulisbacteria bacterium]|nr:flagellar basal body rod protein FlgC [Candidatus Margulisiibacteriota bacterium]
MGLYRAMEISRSGMDAEIIAQQYIASNIANINTTRTLYGEPYRRLVPMRQAKALSFADELSIAESSLVAKESGGVEITEVVQDKTAFRMVYDPSHPDANTNGYVSYPNVDLSKELVDKIASSQLYNANISTFNASKKMIQDTLTLQ